MRMLQRKTKQKALSFLFKEVRNMVLSISKHQHRQLFYFVVTTSLSLSPTHTILAMKDPVGMSLAKWMKDLHTLSVQIYLAKCNAS